MTRMLKSLPPWRQNLETDLPYFQWELKPRQPVAQKMLDDYPMSGPARNSTVEKSRLAAVGCILANNKVHGRQVMMPNFQNIKAENIGFSRKVLEDVLNHLEKVALIGREGGRGCNRSIITYAGRIRPYLPQGVIYYPQSPIFINEKGKGSVMARVNTEERRDLRKRMQRYWSFIQDHEITPGFDGYTFELVNDYVVEVDHKKPLTQPNFNMVLPYIVFNDRQLTNGGRMYGAFWIGLKKELRRTLLIDGEPTCDLDGKGMHVQLLYRLAGEKIPGGDPYIYSDKGQRKIAKTLMLLMMNTVKEFVPEEGRKRVLKTYQKEVSEGKAKAANEASLVGMINELEQYHHVIANEFYRPNWGRLQKTEAALMLKIMERGISENVVVLPVHDGCLCQRVHRDRVLGYFEDLEIEAAENPDHLNPIPIEMMMLALKSVRECRACL